MPSFMKSMYDGVCSICGGPWRAGDMIWFNMGRSAYYDSQHCAGIALGRVPRPVEGANIIRAAYSGTPVTVSPSMGTTTTHSESHREPQHSESWEPEEVCDRPESTQERIERMHEDNVYSMNRIVSAIDNLREALCGVQLK